MHHEFHSALAGRFGRLGGLGWHRGDHRNMIGFRTRGELPQRSADLVVGLTNVNDQQQRFLTKAGIDQAVSAWNCAHTVAQILEPIHQLAARQESLV